MWYRWYAGGCKNAMSSTSDTSTDRSVYSESEVTSYLSEHILPQDTDPLSFWKLHQSNFPLLSKLVERYLSILASLAPVEWLFSIAGKIFQPDRCSLSDSVFQKLIAIKCNGHVSDVTTA